MEGEGRMGGEEFARTVNDEWASAGIAVAENWTSGATMRLGETGAASTRWSKAKCANGQDIFAPDCGF